VKNIRNKLAYVTGGSSGIGLEIARLMASAGAGVVLMARNGSKLQRAKRDILDSVKEQGAMVETVPVDVADEKRVKKALAEAVKKYGPPDILVNSAGMGHSDYFEKIDHKTFDTIMRINLYGTRNVIAAALPWMKERGGHIVILSSEAGLMGVFGYTAYGTSKYALVGLAECLRLEVKRYGIGVTVVCPPEVDTPLVAQEARTIPPEARAVKNVGGRLTPDYVARTVMRAIRRNRFLVVPGFLARMLYHTHRLSNGVLTRITTDFIVAMAARKVKR